MIPNALVTCVLVGASFLFTAQAAILAHKDWYQPAELLGLTGLQLEMMFDRGTGKCIAAPCILPNGIDLTEYTWASKYEVNELITSMGLTGPVNLNGSGSKTYLPGQLEPIFATLNTTSESEFHRYVKGLTRDNDLSDTSNNMFGFWNPVDDEVVEGQWYSPYYHETYQAADMGAWFYREISTSSDVFTVPISFGGLFCLGLIIGRVGWQYARSYSRN